MIIGISDIEVDVSTPTSKGNRSWRWVLSIGLLYLSLQCEFKYTTEDKWTPILNYFELRCRPFYWSFGYEETYYDAMHRSFNFGPFHIYWGS